MTGDVDRAAGLSEFRTSLDAWLDANAEALAVDYEGVGTLDQQMAQLAKIKRLAFDAGWMRSGWPERVGGLGGLDPDPGLPGRGAHHPGPGRTRALLDDRGAGPHHDRLRRPRARRRHGPRPAPRRRDLVPGVLRTGHRQQPGRTGLSGRTHRRRLAGQRPEGLDQPGPVRPPVRPAHPHRHRRVGPPGHHRPVRGHGHARNHGTADRDDARQPRVLRALPRRCGGPLGPHPGRRGRRLGGGHGPLALRAQHVALAPRRLPPPPAPASSSRPPRPVRSTRLGSAR